MAIPIVINTFIFIILALIHIYWAFGGRWAWKVALPAQPDGQVLFKPSVGATLMVGFGLLLFAILTVGNFGWFHHWISNRIINYGNWVITFIFFARAIGDFKFIGLTKKIKNTQFAIRDTRIYSPFCMVIGFFSFLISFFS